MDIALLAVGRLRPYYRAACDEYLKRLTRYARVTEHEVREAARAPSVERRREAEGTALLRHRPAGSTLVCLGRQGEPIGSEALARRLDRWLLDARPLVLAVGGSHGLAPDLLGAADLVWSLGPLTLPHELARVVVVEQLYRAFTILRGEPYHKGS